MDGYFKYPMICEWKRLQIYAPNDYKFSTRNVSCFAYLLGFDMDLYQVYLKYCKNDHTCNCKQN